MSRVYLVLAVGLLGLAAGAAALAAAAISKNDRACIAIALASDASEIKIIAVAREGYGEPFLVR